MSMLCRLQTAETTSSLEKAKPTFVYLLRPKCWENKHNQYKRQQDTRPPNLCHLQAVGKEEEGKSRITKASYQKRATHEWVLEELKRNMSRGNI